MLSNNSLSLLAIFACCSRRSVSICCSNRSPVSFDTTYWKSLATISTLKASMRVLESSSCMSMDDSNSFSLKSAAVSYLHCWLANKTALFFSAILTAPFNSSRSDSNCDSKFFFAKVSAKCVLKQRVSMFCSEAFVAAAAAVSYCSLIFSKMPSNFSFAPRAFILDPICTNSIFFLLSAFTSLIAASNSDFCIASHTNRPVFAIKTADCGSTSATPSNSASFNFFNTVSDSALSAAIFISVALEEATAADSNDNLWLVSLRSDLLLANMVAICDLNRSDFIKPTDSTSASFVAKSNFN
mmetsp:Transcript_2629/g.2745  ORF Transcript_2629/g.2745 Transcript_2629/m.2745 type:complete len:298 (-) Transcript_2629:383-1276(-)